MDSESFSTVFLNSWSTSQLTAVMTGIRTLVSLPKPHLCTFSLTSFSSSLQSWRIVSRCVRSSLNQHKSWECHTGSEFRYLAILTEKVKTVDSSTITLLTVSETLSKYVPTIRTVLPEARAETFPSQTRSSSIALGPDNNTFYCVCKLYIVESLKV